MTKIQNSNYFGRDDGFYNLLLVVDEVRKYRNKTIEPSLVRVVEARTGVDY